MYKDLIHDLRRYGLTNGTALGRHMGIMDEAADAIERLISDLEEANKRAKTAEAERDAAVEDCSGRCETCVFLRDCAKHDNNCDSPPTWYTDCEDWKWRGGQEGKNNEKI